VKKEIRKTEDDKYRKEQMEKCAKMSPEELCRYIESTVDKAYEQGFQDGQDEAISEFV